MRSSYFFLPATALTIIVSRIAAAPVIDTIEQLDNSRTLIANNIVKRQASPICSSVCGAPNTSSCTSISVPVAQVCNTETFPDPNGGNCNIVYIAPSDGTCITSDDFANLATILVNTCSSASTSSGGCIDGANGARVCLFSSESPCH